MTHQDVPLDKLHERDFQLLLSMGVAESLYLDYKKETYGEWGNDRSEFLADISSFANTLGGDLLIGLTEKNGQPIGLNPFRGDVDAEKRRLEQIALSGLEPRIPNLQIHSVPIATGGHAIVVRIPRSFVPPHRVIARESNRFWARAGSTKYQPNVEQLRRIFSEGSRLSERIRAFYVDRLVKIAAGDTPIAMNRNLGKVVLHVISVPSFADGRMTDVVSRLNEGTHVPVALDELNLPRRAAVNLDGYLNYAVMERTRSSYAQFFRNGVIEGVAELRTDDRGGPGCLNRFSASISGGSAKVRLPSGVAAG